MEVTIEKTHIETVTLSQEEAIRVTEETIRQKLKLPTGCFIDNEGMLVKVEEQWGGCHSWDNKTPLRKATKRDRAALDILNELSA